jgi:hypothetical protein
MAGEVPAIGLWYGKKENCKHRLAYEASSQDQKRQGPWFLWNWICGTSQDLHLPTMPSITSRIVGQCSGSNEMLALVSDGCDTTTNSPSPSSQISTLVAPSSNIGLPFWTMKTDVTMVSNSII